MDFEFAEIIEGDEMNPTISAETSGVKELLKGSTVPRGEENPIIPTKI